jgi:hypothetical protein
MPCTTRTFPQYPAILYKLPQASTDLVASALQRDYHQMLGLLLSNRYTPNGVH